MSNANADQVQSMYAAFGRGEIAALLDNAAPNVVWEIEGRAADHPLFRKFEGRAGMQEFFATLADMQDAEEFSPREFYPSGDKVFVLGHYAWKYKKTGRRAAANFVHIFTLQNGKLTAFREFTDTAVFAEAVRPG
jgi:hypothetical protein